MENETMSKKLIEKQKNLSLITQFDKFLLQYFYDKKTHVD